MDKIYGVNTISNLRSIKVGTIDCPIFDHQEGYKKCYDWIHLNKIQGNMIVS